MAKLTRRRRVALLTALLCGGCSDAADAPEPYRYEDTGPNAACEEYLDPPAHFDTTEVDGSTVPALHGATLDCVDLGGMDLTGADLGEALLVGARLADARLAGANLAGARLTAADLTGADLSGADLTGALLDRANLSGADLSGASLTGVSATKLAGCPEKLPELWLCVAGDDGRSTLVGPGARLFGADLSGADLGAATLDDVHGAGLLGCPTRLPAGSFTCVEQAGGRFALIGPGLDLTGASFEGVDLGAADLRGLRATGLDGCPATPPRGWRCFTSSTGANLVGPGADVRGADLGGADLSGMDLTDTNLDLVTGIARAVDLVACPAVLPNAFVCVAQAGNGFALVGPRVDLTGVAIPGADLHDVNLYLTNLTDADLSGANLSGAFFAAAWLTRANLTGADLTSADLAGAADLSFLRATDLVGCPATLPDGFFCIGTASRTFAIVTKGGSLEGIDLSGGVAREVGGVPFQDCPVAVPAGWKCVKVQPSTQADPAFALVGPGTVLTGLSLGGADLSGVDLSTANLLASGLADLVACPEALPAGYRCIPGGTTGTTTFVILGPGLGYPLGLKLPGADLTNLDLGARGVPSASSFAAADFTGADFTGTDLTGASLSGADLTGARLAQATLTGLYAVHLRGCPADLPAGWRCVTDVVPPPFDAVPLFDLVGPGARIPRIDLTAADLAGADLTGAELTGAVLTGVDLTGTNLSGALLDLAELTSVTWSNTTCPDGTNSDAVGGTCVGHLTP